MYKVTLLIFCATVAQARFLHPADKINSLNLGWTAYPQDFAIHYPMGVPGDVSDVHAAHVKLSVQTYEANELLPAEFDARQRWPLCNETIGNIRDQSRCGSCWAVSSAGVFSDRMCIASGGRDYAVSYSADDTMSCCQGDCGAGCSGGYPGLAWNWFVDVGVVTGGNYTDQYGCLPYPFPPKAMSNYATPACAKKCQSDWKFDSYQQDKHHASTSFRVLANDTEQMQLHLLKGTLVVCFAVYDDFFHYKSGVYRRSPDAQYVGMHAVRLIGWGMEQGIPYWLIANSWDTTWGDNGYFKMLRGSNECGIESTVVAGDVHW